MTFLRVLVLILVHLVLFLQRLTLPLHRHTREEEKAQRWIEVRKRQHTLKHGEVQPSIAFQSSLVDTGFSLSDIKGEQQEGTSFSSPTQT